MEPTEPGGRSHAQDPAFVLPATAAESVMLGISAVERDTGLSKDVLRMWERRYGFPSPMRDRHGERMYSAGEIAKLRAIRRLMDRGHRPGKIIALELPDLHALGAAPTTRSEQDADLQEILALIGGHQLPELRQRLSRRLMKQGLQRFVLDSVAPLTTAVGEAWARGEFAVFEEHLYTEQVQSLLRSAIATVQAHGKAPRVLLTSFPTEQHSLGLLMVESLLACEGATCIPLGAQMPVEEIVRAVAAHGADAVALSFSAAYPERQVAPGLRTLRASLPGDIDIWAGGACVRRLRKGIDGVNLVRSLEQVGTILGHWRATHARD
jgi:methylmalonyl-CoA mutase cobalamin-binding subunit/DNA-binding transcriptional MerR regulator